MLLLIYRIYFSLLLFCSNTADNDDVDNDVNYNDDDYYDYHEQQQQQQQQPHQQYEQRSISKFQKWSF